MHSIRDGLSEIVARWDEENGEAADGFAVFGRMAHLYGVDFVVSFAGLHLQDGLLGFTGFQGKGQRLCDVFELLSWRKEMLEFRFRDGPGSAQALVRAWVDDALVRVPVQDALPPFCNAQRVGDAELEPPLA